MALQIKNLDGKIKLKKGGFVFETPVIRFGWATMRKTKNIKFEFWFVVEGKEDYSDIECVDVVYEKDVKTPIGSIPNPNNENEVSEIIGYNDVIEKVQIPNNLTKEIKTFEDVEAHFEFVDNLPISASLSTPKKMMLGYHLWAQQLLAPTFGIENIVIRLELA
jgi:hypothetical protein